ncbi:MAG: SIS domain-containing protein [Candidatus Aegiribacteria sp.]|nr:SIS domain-containing protein [Candidatus Aegiribacteria sp.]MBD3294381.1 SIS domain-containing protein [Candidatus Fermentibacteria bacterium]
MSSLVLKIPSENIEELANILLKAYRNGNRVFIFGNGGGASTSSHFACDLAKGTATPGKPRLKALSLSDNVPLITAWANDTDYTNTFGEQLMNLVEKDDVVMGLSGSGMSPNVINAFKVANRAGAVSVLLSGFRGGEAVKVANSSIVVPSEDMQQIEDIHLMLCHIVFRMIKSRIQNDEEAQS